MYSHPDAYLNNVGGLLKLPVDEPPRLALALAGSIEKQQQYWVAVCFVHRMRKNKLPVAIATAQAIFGSFINSLILPTRSVFRYELSRFNIEPTKLFILRKVLSYSVLTKNVANHCSTCLLFSIKN